MILETIDSPQDVKALAPEQLDTLAQELRDTILHTVSQNGGHLASNLGVIELTIALHRVFDCPKDSIVFDVGHQSYAHKLLTGRREAFSTLRQYQGISGFPKISESPYDAFGCGHSSTSISAAVGIATAKTLKGDNSFTIAVIGDGAFTGGMAYEAINNCAECKNLIIVLNDNEMSIGKNVGAIDSYLNRYRNSARYFKFKNGTKHFFLKIPLIGKGLVKVSKSVKNGVKRILVQKNLFEHLGLSYYGPLDGNNESLLETVFQEAKQDGKCSVVHICTKKGKGYQPAEDHPELYHGVGPFSLENGVSSTPSASFSYAFGKALCELAEQDSSICAITAAMPDGTGLSDFQKKYPERFFDVGIAEEHATTFACGLASQGMKPAFAVYSTFAQRAYDQIIHDCAIQNLPVVFAFDRAGLVGADGTTHHGIFDVSFLNAIPNLTVFSPECYAEVRECLSLAFRLGKPTVIRYPRGKETDYPRSTFYECNHLKVRDFGKNPLVCLISYGRITQNAILAAAGLHRRGISTRIIKLVQIKPLNPEKIHIFTTDIPYLYFLEEGMREGGIAEHLFSELSESGQLDGKKFRIRAVNEKFLAHGSTEELFRECGFLPDQVEAEIMKLVSSGEN